MIKGKDYKIENGHLTIFDGVTDIVSEEFYRACLTSVKMPNSITTIGKKAFYQNFLSSVEFSNNITNIASEAFYYNNLSSVEIPNGIKVIEPYAFARNKLTNVKIPNSVTHIMQFAFYHNELDTIEIPNSVELIENYAFDDIDIIYDNTLISRELVQKYGCKNIIKLYKILKVITASQVCKIPKAVLEIIPPTEEAIKGYILNRKVFEDLNTFVDTSDEYKDFFKMCFALGLFSKPDEDVIRFIKQIKEEKTKNYIHQMWTAVELTLYKPKFKDLFMKLYNEVKTDYKGQNIIGRLYSSFEKINKYTLKRHEDIIGKKNSEIKRLKEMGGNTIYLEQELEKLKKDKKNIEYDDIIYYIKNNVLEVREGNEPLKDVSQLISVHLGQQDFDKIQDLYEESINVEKNIPVTIDTSDNSIRYHWSLSSNPINTILGYIVNCCARQGGAAEDIMRQSMINPDVANLIIYDENNQVIGKATAYYNRSKKYILFNNAETKEIGTKGLKSAKQRQKECLEALIRGAMDATRALKEKGEVINEVRIGMLRNNLEDAIKEYGLEISSDLLESYPWKNYDGDASDINAGQAIIYKDEEFEKNKNI